jgi:hypothetical protein
MHNGISAAVNHRVGVSGSFSPSCSSPGCALTTERSGVSARRRTSSMSEIGRSPSPGGFTTACRPTSTPPSQPPSLDAEAAPGSGLERVGYRAFPCDLRPFTARPARVLGSLERCTKCHLAGVSRSGPPAAKPCTGVRFPSSPPAAGWGNYLLSGSFRLTTADGARRTTADVCRGTPLPDSGAASYGDLPHTNQRRTPWQSSPSQ